MFTEAWNNHGLRTCHNASPRQFFVSGCLRLRNSGLIALDFLDDIDNKYGTGGEDNEVQAGDESDYVELDRQAESIEVPASRVQLSAEQFELLSTQIDPLSLSDNHGIEKYERALAFIQSWVSHVP